MGLNTLTTRSAGETILDSFFNDFKTAFGGDLVGRDNSGVPASGKNLGTTAIPWGTIRGTGLVLNGASVDASQITAPEGRIISGKTRSTSNQPQFIDPDGAAAELTVEGATTNLVVDIAGNEVVWNTDVVKTALALAPSTNNTALVNQTAAADGNDTRARGENGPTVFSPSFPIDTAGSEITDLIGTWQAFKIEGVSTEYMLAYIESATELNRCFRGFFYDSAGAPINRTAYSNNDTLTLMKLHWVFIDSDLATVDTTTTNPTYSFSAPSSPATGDYWRDLQNDVWKRYDGAQFVIVSRTLIGLAVCDDTNCVAARSFDFFAAYDSENDIELERNSTEIIQTKEFNQVFHVAGKRILFGSTRPDWNITTDLATGDDIYNVSEQASTIYYLYMKDTGDTVISDIEPYRRDDLRGNYHPHNPWRCFGWFLNDSGSDIKWFFYSAAVKTPQHQLFRQNAGQSFNTGVGAFIDFSNVVTDPFNLVTTGANWECAIPIRCRAIANAHVTFISLASNTGTINVLIRNDGNDQSSGFCDIGSGSSYSGYSGEASISAGPYQQNGLGIQARASQSNGSTRSLSGNATTNVMSILFMDFLAIP